MINRLIKLMVACLLQGYFMICVYADGGFQTAKISSSVCVSCHGEKGNSLISAYPNLAGQNEKYFIKQMLAFKTSQRENPIMQSIAKTISEQDTSKLAVFYANQQAEIGTAKRELLSIGERLFRAGNAKRHIPACMACHGPAGEGNSLAGFPRLAGQHAAYVQVQLISYRLDKRKSRMMRDIAKRLTENEIVAIANYLAGLHQTH
jgi:cytochrome c553